MKLEVIAINLADVELINKSNADRIEFCHHLEVGGLTPSYEEIEQTAEQSKLPINVMLRPTARDFYYTETEFEQMLTDLKFIVTTKVNGIVVGIINPDGTINKERMQKIMELKGDKKVTFHRAFEQVKDQIQGLKDLAELGVDSLLTSGTGNINESFDLLKELTSQNLVTIIGGSGINQDNIVKVSENVNEIHVGTAVRDNQNWSSPINVQKINELKEKIKGV